MLQWCLATIYLITQEIPSDSEAGVFLIEMSHGQTPLNRQVGRKAWRYRGPNGKIVLVPLVLSRKLGMPRRGGYRQNCVGRAVGLFLI